MSDITKCKGEGCPMKETCRRFTANEGPMQSYFAEIPLIIIRNIASCDMYWGETQDHVFNFLKKITE